MPNQFAVIIRWSEGGVLFQHQHSHETTPQIINSLSIETKKEKKQQMVLSQNETRMIKIVEGREGL